MIQEVVTKKGAAAITSDQWYVVHSRFVDRPGELPYMRGIHSEHADRLSCRKAAAALRERIQADNAAAPPDQRDEVFARKPLFKTLKASRSVHADGK